VRAHNPHMTRNVGGAATSLMAVPEDPLSIAYMDAKIRAGRAGARLSELCEANAPASEIKRAAEAAREASSLLAGYAHQIDHE
jgi:hypothetical protein